MRFSRATDAARELPILGWKEIAALPEWGIDELKIKLDTGAKSSALHVENLRDATHGGPLGWVQGDGQEEHLPIVAFEIPLSRLDRGPFVTVESPVVGYRSVRDTRARPERRPVIRTRLRCGSIDDVIDVTLTNRSGMLFRMIVGRRVLKDRVLVDPGRTFTTRRVSGDAHRASNTS